jgi:AraC family transcriptional regulator, regulatory protein of adaptative response / methylated-DNA-[protein]-cysteine methyltransferase
MHDFIQTLAHLPFDAIVRSNRLETPASYAPLKTEYADIVLAWTKHGVCGCVFGNIEEGLQDLRRNWPKAVFMESDLQSCPPHALHFIGTDFQHAVWTQLRGIPAGQTWTYTQLAESMNRPTAVRTVASALAKNPLAVIVPCHRVIHKNKNKNAYRWGSDVKKKLRESLIKQ